MKYRALLADPRLAFRLILHRRLRPWRWRTVIRSRFTSLSDKEFLDRLGLTGLVDDAVAAFRERVRLRFLFHPRNQKEFFLGVLTSAQSYDSIVDEGEWVLENTFDTLGSGLTDLGPVIDWHRDFKSGHRWPLQPSHTIDMEGLGLPSDVKVPWELSRFHQAWWLGKAYWVTHHESYAEKFGALINHWIDENPPGFGVNWGNGMEAAIRASNWIAGYYFFCDARSLKASFWIRLLRSLYEHGMYIEHHLEESWRNHNHLISDLTGLVLLGLLFKDSPDGKRWLKTGTDGLVRELRYQVEPDGVDYEKSVSYHRLVTELFTVPAILCTQNGVPLPAEFWKRLEAMYGFIASYIRPDGSVPLVGDADDGRLFRTTMREDLNDHRGQLAVGAVLFQRRDWKLPGQAFPQDVLWMLGGRGFEEWQRLGEGTPDVPSRLFPDGGFAVMRNERTHVFIDAGDIGQRGRGGHGHNDLLSFEYWHAGHPVVVDSGTYGYTFDPAARQEFRSTRSHNTALVDGLEQAEFASLWEIKEDRTAPRILQWNAGSEYDLLEAEHHAYAHAGIVHRRRFRFDRRRGTLSIEDSMLGTGTHTCDAFFHLAPGTAAVIESPHKAVATIGNSRYIFAATAGVWNVDEGWFSRSYGLRTRTSVLRLQWKGRAPLAATVLIEPVLPS